MPMTAFLTAIAMIAFAANSILAREALADGAMDAAGFTGLRLASGAVALALVLALRLTAKGKVVPGSWLSALALFVYAIAFSFAYVQLGAATGALVLFVSVQLTMIGWGIVRGERPSALQWAGIVMALAGFVYLVSPALTRPDPVATMLMITAGIAWGVYSLRGRGSRDPIDDTAGNFIRTMPLALALLAFATLVQDNPAGTLSGRGIGLAVASGVLASAAGYVVWYRVLPHLAAIAAAIVQLSVPVITAAAGVLFLAEPLTIELVLAGMLILSGLALAIATRRKA
jgi:drug/metabolite transporter (DMT)-like permease